MNGERIANDNPAPPTPADEHEHRQGRHTIPASSIRIDGCLPSRCAVISLVDAADRPFADAHLPLGIIEDVIAQLRKVAADVGAHNTGETGHG